MNATGFEAFEVQASVTDRFQTTLPTAVRAVLGIEKREKIVFRISAGGVVEVARADAQTREDAALAPFLALLSRRLASHPEHIAPYTADEADADAELVPAQKVIVFAWLNGDGTMRKAGARTDVYAGFKAMLDAGRPPGDFDELLMEASTGK